MTKADQIIFNDLLNGLENLGAAVDALEAVLIRKGLMTTAEIEAILPAHAEIAAGKLAATRRLVSSQITRG